MSEAMSGKIIPFDYIYILCKALKTQRKRFACIQRKGMETKYCQALKVAKMTIKVVHMTIEVYSKSSEAIL